MSRTFTKTAAAIIAALLAVVIAVFSSAPAQAVTVPGWGQWLMPAGTICMQTGGSTYWPIAQAAAAWNKSDATVVAKTSCRGYARSMTVLFKAYYDTRTSKGLVVSCGKFYSDGWSWQKVRGVWTWTPNTPSIGVNLSAIAKRQCHDTVRKRLTTVSHETGHVLGLDHAVGITVMTAQLSRYSVPTSYDIARVNRRY